MEKSSLMFTLAKNYVDSPLESVGDGSGDLNVSPLTYFPQAVVSLQCLRFKIRDPESYSQFSGERFQSQHHPAPSGLSVSPSTRSCISGGCLNV